MIKIKMVSTKENSYTKHNWIQGHTIESSRFETKVNYVISSIELTEKPNTNTYIIS